MCREEGTSTSTRTDEAEPTASDEGPGSASAHPRPRRPLLPAHQELEGESRSRLRGQGATGACALPRAARRRGRAQLRRDGTGQPLPAPRARLGGEASARAAARHLQPPPRRPLPLVAALDVHASYLRARLRPRRDGNSTLTFIRQIRLAYPRSTRIYWIQDNLSCHWTPAIRAWAEQNNVELVPTPTYASYPNRIESHFGAIGEFVVKNADYLDWGQLRARDRQAHQLPQRSRPPPRAARTHSNSAATGGLNK
jgi:transposase